ncbi:short chain dehydrogenase, partial [Zobellella denitrificans]
MSFKLQGKVAVVTGGSSGIGLETVRLLLAEGARVAWCGRNPGRLAASLEEMRAAFPGAECLTRPCNVLDKAEVAAFAAAVEARFGGADLLINNAGQGRVSNFEQTEDEDWVAEIRLKTFSVLHPIRAFLPQLERSDCPSITNVNSLLALQPEPHMIATSAARAA